MLVGQPSDQAGNGRKYTFAVQRNEGPHTIDSRLALSICKERQDYLAVADKPERMSVIACAHPKAAVPLATICGNWDRAHLSCPMPEVRRSKRLSYWLRHAPQAAGLKLDTAGWAPVEAVLSALAEARLPTTLVELNALVAASDKQRFELSVNGLRIRARQGHSIDVEGDWPVAAPPELLFHGTVGRSLASILEQGLLPGGRHHVHLSSTIEGALAVGARRGKPILLQVAASKMVRDGLVFRVSSNGVWLVDRVPPSYLEVLR